MLDQMDVTGQINTNPIGQALMRQSRYNVGKQRFLPPSNEMPANKIRYFLLILAATLAQVWLQGLMLNGQATFTDSPTSEINSPVTDVENDTKKKRQSNSVVGSADSDEVHKLIEQLGSSSFAERQFATEQLWRFGPIVVKSLQKALSHPDPEVVKRVRSMLDVMEVGVDSSTPRSTALMVLYFKNGEPEVRAQIIQNLERQQNYQLVFDLLNDLKNPDDQRELYEDEIELDRTVYRLALQGKWETLDKILTHDIPWKFDHQLCIFYSILQNKFDDKIEALRERITGYESEHPQVTPQPRVADQAPPNSTPGDEAAKTARDQYQRDLLQITRMLRIANKRSDAFIYARKISDPAQRLRLINGMDMESGNWAAVADRLVLKQDKVAGDDETVLARLPQIALAHYFAGNNVEYKIAIDQLTEMAKQPAANDDSDPESELVDVLLATLNWQEAEKHLNLKPRNRVFQLYVFLQRNEDALQAVGLTDQINQRLIWFQRLTNQLDSIFKQYARATGKKGINRTLHKQIGIPTIDEDKVDAKAATIFDLGVTAASHLGSLGFTDEAVFHLRAIADTITQTSPGSYEKRAEILSVLIDLGAYEEAWNLLEDRFQENEYLDAFRVMFPYKYSNFQFWFLNLKDGYPDLLQRARYVARIVNSPLQQESGPLDLKSVFSLVDSTLSNSSSTKRSGTNYQFAMTLFYNGDSEASRRYLKAAARDGSYYAETRLADIAMEVGDYELALELYERLWRRSASATATTYSARAAAECFEILGDPEKSRQRKLIAYGAWLESYRTDQVVDQFERNKKIRWLEPVLNVSVHGTKGSLLTNEYYRQALAASQEEDSPRQAANNLRVELFNRFASTRSSNSLSIANTAGRVQLNLAVAELKSGNVDQAYLLLKDFDKFRPGDPEIGENLIPLFDELGETRKANNLFQGVADYYVATLIRYPESPLHHNNYAWFCASSKRRLDYSQYHSGIAVSLRPNNSSYLDTLAELKFLNGDPETAKELSRKCLQIQPSKRHYLRQFLRFGGKL